VIWLVLLLLALCIAASALYSGGETGVYSLWRARVHLEAEHGRSAARMIRALLRDEVALLITILIGNNLTIELATHLGGDALLRVGVPEAAREVVLALALTPLVFFFGELLPKDLFRRRPHALTGVFAPFLIASRALYLPLAVPLRLLTRALELLGGVGGSELVEARGRGAVLSLLEAGKRSGALEAEAERMARNALQLKATPVERVMVPWDRVVTLRGDLSPRERYERVAASEYTRLPWIPPEGPVEDYLHQLEALAAGPEADLGTCRRPLPCLPPDLPLDRALARLRGAGQRAALVGSPSEPLGLVTLKDLVEEISGDLARW